MLWIILIYAVGKTFYNLAHDYYKSRWLFAILGVLSYYLGAFIGGVLLAIIFELTGADSIDRFPNLVIGLMVMPFGILLSFIFYLVLRKLWNQEPKHVDSDILDQEI